MNSEVYSKIEKTASVESLRSNREENIYELARADMVFCSNEVVKLEIAAELHRQGVSAEAISRILSIPAEDLYPEIES